MAATFSLPSLPSGAVMPRDSKVKIGGILKNDHLARISVMGVPDRPGTAAALLAVFGETGINVQFIVQCIDQHEQDHIVLCVDRSDLEVALRLACEVQAELCATTISFDPEVASLGIYGPDFRERPGIAGSMFSALAARSINIQAISTSVSTVTVIISADRVNDGVAAIQDTFELP
jgi:aspartate kinase